MLSKSPKIKYSPSEQAVFIILSKYAGRKKKLPTTQLVSWDLYGNLDEMPFHAYQMTGGIIRSLRKKLIANEEPFKLEKIKVPGKKVMWQLEKNHN